MILNIQHAQSIYNYMKKRAIYRTYRYLIIGHQGVGKTNLLTRFLRDQFLQHSNLVLEGQHKIFLTIRRTTFEIVLEDKYNVPDLTKLSEDILLKIDGVIMMFSFELENSFDHIEKQLEYLRAIIKQKIKRKRKMAIIIVGNKSQNGNYMLEMGQNGGELEFTDRISVNEKARNLARKMEVGYMQISTKYSPKEQIEEVFITMINENELYYFEEQERKEKRGLWNTFLPRMPCSDSEGSCEIY